MTTPAPPPQPARMTYNAPAAPVSGPSSGGVVPRGITGALSGAARTINSALPATQRGHVPTTTANRLPLPAWLADRRLVIASWAVAMVLVTLDEHRSGYLLPRPARLWSATLLYGLLAAAGSVELIIPIVNMLAIGYTVAVGMQYFEHTGMFGQAPSPAQAPSPGGPFSGGPGMGKTPAPGSGTSPAGPAR